ncbi:DNA primase [Methylobacterium sp. PvP062]|uniref:DNA primase n=1 Tax=Methylobacterium radiotolerans TaxID=31998 RepID=A0ABV2NU49_9HYPH|nr:MULTISPECIES: hypothetical protein [unclassified Methylobacterium]MBP2498425.1 DNA primase [Methylobacterium sp. PvP105]MBP2505604.1 DNA primase [Methylobacterium sp. PvP109]
MSDFQELSEELDLEQWFDREGLAYKGPTRGSSGMQINVKDCPQDHCRDGRYRVYLNAESGIGNCFVCETRFNKLSFVNAFLHGDKDAKKWGETLKHVKAACVEQGWRPKRTITAAVEVPDEIKLPDSFALPTADGQNLKYLESRGIGVELAAYFRLRYCDSGWWNWTKDDGSRGGQKWEQRLLIPVYDLDGKLVTFQGRDIIGDQDAKYLFPPALPGTGRFLYNGHNAVRARRIAMGEGAFDVFSLKAAIDGESELRDIVPVGSFGKHLSTGDLEGRDQLGQLLVLKGYGLQEVIICWDGTPDALAAAVKAAESIRKIGLKARIALLPLDQDPNEAKPEVVRKALWQAQEYSPRLAVEWRLRNPYTALRRAKAPLTA